MDSLLFALHQQARTDELSRRAEPWAARIQTAMTSRVSSAGFVGRSAELAELEAALRERGLLAPLPRLRSG